MLGRLGAAFLLRGKDLCTQEGSTITRDFLRRAALKTLPESSLGAMEGKSLELRSDSLTQHVRE